MVWGKAYNQACQMFGALQEHTFVDIWNSHLKTEQPIDKENSAEDRELSSQTAPPNLSKQSKS